MVCAFCKVKVLKFYFSTSLFVIHVNLNHPCSFMVYYHLLNKLTSVFYASVLLLIMNFVITLSKWLWIHEAIPEWIRRRLTLTLT